VVEPAELPGDLVEPAELPDDLVEPAQLPEGRRRAAGPHPHLFTIW